jgi:hypothetical protein
MRWGIDSPRRADLQSRAMGKFSGLALLSALALWLTGCASGDPRLQGTWKSNKVPMPVEMVKVTKTETVRVSKRSKKTKKVKRTVMVPKPKSAPRYIDIVLRCEGARLTFEFPTSGGEGPRRISVPYKVAAADDRSVVLDLREPFSKTTERVQISFDGPNRFWVSPAGGEGWKEYYVRVPKDG